MGTQMRRLAIPLALFATLLLVSCAGGKAGGDTFYCPMHPQIMAEKPGDCPICGMHLVLHEKQAAPAGAKYACPMHPSVTSDKPGDCSICGMHLVLQKPGSGPDEGDPSLAAIELSPLQRRQLGLTLGVAGKRRLGSVVRAPGRIVPDETRIYRVVARADGYVDELDLKYAGLPVKKDQVLLSIYSPSIQAAQQQFIGTTPTEGRRFPGATAKPAQDPPEASDRDDAFRQRLKYWGFGDRQIERIQKNGKVENSLDVEAPAAGIVTEKNTVLGQRVSPGDTLFVITDLSRVWTEVDVPESDVPQIREGLPLTVTLSSLPGRSFPGTVKVFQPILDGQTRTMKVYAEVANPGTVLKPGMLGTVDILLPETERLAVPEGAVLRAGERDYVFVDEGGGKLAPRTVTLGVRGGGYYEILSGLSGGESVVTSGNFLVDSESSLKAALLSADTR